MSLSEAKTVVLKPAGGTVTLNRFSLEIIAEKSVGLTEGKASRLWPCLFGTSALKKTHWKGGLYLYNVWIAFAFTLMWALNTIPLSKVVISRMLLEKTELCIWTSFCQLEPHWKYNHLWRACKDDRLILEVYCPNSVWPTVLEGKEMQTRHLLGISTTQDAFAPEVPAMLLAWLSFHV